MAFSALVACLLSAVGICTSAAARTAEARASTPSRPAAAPSARRPATPAVRQTSHRREVSRLHGRRTGVRATAAVDGPGRRDPAQDLIPAIGPDTLADGPRVSPRAACLQATQRAERVHGLPPGLLTAIALAESGLHAYALSIGGRAHFPETEEAARALIERAPPGRSVMAGCVQVNARVHARNSHWPLNPTASADWAGGMMARWAGESGSWSTALRRWHGGSPSSTQRLVCRVRAKMEITNPGSNVFDDYNCNAAHAERTRRNGAVHLATAQRQSD